MTNIVENKDTFTGVVEVTTDHRVPTQAVEAEIKFRIDSRGELEFLSVTSQGKEIPLYQVSETSLICSYAKYRGISL